MNAKRKIVLSLILCMLMCGCDKSTTSANTESTQQTISAPAETDTSEMFTERDMNADFDRSRSALITLNGTTIQSTSDAAQINGTTVRLTEEGTYIISGKLDNGQIIVDAEKTDKIQIVLDGAEIHSSNSAAIYILRADKVFLTTADNTQNILSNGGTFTAVDENNIDAVIFSKDDLTLNGYGTLSVKSPAGHGIVTKDDLAVTGGNYIIDSLDHGLSGKESVRIADGKFTISSGKDGIHAEDKDDAELGFCYISGGNINITANGDGIDSASYVSISGGTLKIKTNGVPINNTTTDTIPSADEAQPMGGGMKETGVEIEFESSSKGINAETKLSVSGGEITVDSASHCLHCQGEINISGGNFNLGSNYEKGISAHGDLIIDGEQTLIDITKSTEGIESKNILTINNGTIKIVASDDAINATGGNSGAMMGGGKHNFDNAGEFMPPEGVSPDDNIFPDGIRIPGNNTPPENITVPDGSTPPEDTKQFENGRGDRNERPETPQAEEGAVPPDNKGQGGMGGTQTDCLIINGGYLQLCSYDDCLDANGNMLINDGVIKACNAKGSFTGVNSIFDSDGRISVGDKVCFIGVCGARSQAVLTSVQHTVTIFGEETYKAGSNITVKDETGKILAEYVPDEYFSSVIILSPEMELGKTYTVSIDSETHEVAVNDHNTIIGTEDKSSGMGGFRGERPNNGGFGGRAQWPYSKPTET